MEKENIIWNVPEVAEYFCCNTHMTKHTFVTRAIESGMSLLTISKLVGTSVRELEKTYVHVLDEFMGVELEGLRKHLKNSKIIAFPKVEQEQEIS